MFEQDNTRNIDRFYQRYFYNDYKKIPPEIIDGFLIPEKEYLTSVVDSEAEVIDLGCGDGRILQYLQTITLNLTGIDYSKRQCQVAKTNIPKATIIQCDAIQTPFTRFSFDYVLCTFNTLGNMGSDKEKVLQEMFRICRNKGRTILTLYSKNALEHQIKFYENFGLTIKHINERFVEVNEGLLSERFSHKEISDLLSGFDVTYHIQELSDIAYLVEIEK